MEFLIHQTIDAWARQEPQRNAAVFLDQGLRYADLAAQSNCLAHALVAQGVRRYDRVGIYMDKRIETPVALYGIMKAGAAYVPLDPSAPPDRIAFMLRDCGIRHIVTENSKLKKLTLITERYSGLESLLGVSRCHRKGIPGVSWEQILSKPSKSAPDVKMIGDDLAYIIYTSGSTGVPKGIMHSHQSGLSFARWAAHEYGLDSMDRVSNHAPLHFDLSIFDYFATAVAGAGLVIIPDEYTKLPPSYSKLIAEQRVTVLFTVPFALIQLLLNGVIEERDLSALRWVIFGGEPFPVKHLRALMAKLPHVLFDNMYGPAEVNGVTHYTVRDLPDDVDSIPIGPVSSIADCRVVDHEDQTVPLGEPGELLIRSPTMMKGYWGQPELTETSIQYHRISDAYPAPFYRTGDMVSQNSEGNFMFLGRKDRQIKVRGYRVELDEVEAALANHSCVKEAAVFSIPAQQGSQRILGAVTLESEEPQSETDLIVYVKAKLPWYAVPEKLEIRTQFPRTTTGKIDRRKLCIQAMDIRKRAG